MCNLLTVSETVKYGYELTGEYYRKWNQKCEYHCSMYKNVNIIQYFQKSAKGELEN